MIPAQNSTTVLDLMPSISEHAFTIGDASWVMESLADLYSDREMAVIREYSTNARDAQNANGNFGPIEVALPDMNMPTFKVRDYGVGMSLEQLTTIYNSFGISTKRESNAYNGMLGFGSKAAAAYTSQFTVTSWHNGEKIVAMVTRDPETFIKLKIIGIFPSDEPSGVEIQVPVENWRTFADKMRRFYSFWEDGTHNVPGVTYRLDEASKVSDNIYKMLGSGVVMGGVFYPIENSNRLFKKIPAFDFVATIPNGSVEFTNSREALKYTEKTKSYLEALIEALENEAVSTYNTELAQAKTHAEAYSIWQKHRDRWGNNFAKTLTFKGDTISSNGTVPLSSDSSNTYIQWFMTRSKYTTSDKSDVPIDSFIIKNAPANLSGSHKAKIKDYFAIKNINHRVVSWIQSDWNNPWLTDSIVDWADIKAALPKKTVVSGYSVKDTAGSFDTLLPNGRLEESLVVCKKPVYIETKTYNNLGFNKNTVTQFMERNNIARIYIIPANRIDKFNRLHDTTHVMKMMKSDVISDINLLFKNEDDEMAYWLNDISYTLSYLRTSIQGLCDRIDDPMVVKFLSSSDVTDYIAQEEIRYYKNLCNMLGVVFDTKTNPITNYFNKEYPLWNRVKDAPSSLIVDYFNMAYNFKEKK